VSLREQIRQLRQIVLGDPARRFASASLVLTLSLAIAPAKNFFSPWRQYQRQFLKLVRSRPDSAALHKRFKSGIHQIWIPEQGVADRCSTCHLGLEEVTLTGVRQQPFRPHPPIPHSLSEFGCVICHRGQGEATTVQAAHGVTQSWEQPILPAKYLESSCGQCHLGAVEGTPKLNTGRQLLARLGCAHCHTITQPDSTALAPNDDPPPLGHIAEKTSREWLFAWIKNPQAYAASSTMPDFQLNDQQAADIASFLISQSTPSAAQMDQADDREKGQPGGIPEQGASFYGASFCSSCHAIQNTAGNLVGGDFGPELTRIGSKVNPGWLRRWLANPRAYDSRTRMPHYRFDENQVALLAEFLLSKKDDDFLAAARPPAPDSGSVARGMKLVVEYGCASCHEINGVNRPRNFAPDLSRVGSKALAQIVFTGGRTKTLPGYLAGKLRDPRASQAGLSQPGLKMPKYSLSGTQVEALTTALLAQTDRAWSQPRELLRCVSGPSNFHVGGEAGRLIEDLRCQSCHSINGNGGDIAPQLTWEGSAVQGPWLEDFMRNPNTLRPASIRRMPNFNLTSAEVKTISEYILSARQNPELDSDALDPLALNSAAATRGKELFYAKYGCQSCHIANYKTDKGYIGPPLAATGDRRPAVWVYTWLKNPQKVEPNTLMPNPNVSDTEARDLTAFLMSLKTEKTGSAR